MDLKKFNELTLNNANEAKNFMSFLLGYNFKTSDASKAIIGFYDALSDNIKKEDKVFAPMFLKFFEKYDIEKDNFKYYEKFAPL